MIVAQSKCKLWILHQLSKWPHISQLHCLGGKSRWWFLYQFYMWEAVQKTLVSLEHMNSLRKIGRVIYIKTTPKNLHRMVIALKKNVLGTISNILKHAKNTNIKIMLSKTTYLLVFCHVWYICIFPCICCTFTTYIFSHKQYILFFVFKMLHKWHHVWILFAMFFSALCG